MLVEREFQSIALGQQARDFIVWSRDTGATLSSMYRRRSPKVIDIAHGWQEKKKFPHGELEVLHPKDWMHHPAVLLARKHTQTFIQLLPPFIGSTKERFASLTQVGYDDLAIKISPTSGKIPYLPYGIALTFGRHQAFPNNEGIRGTAMIHISTEGKTQCYAPKRTPTYQMEDQIQHMMKHLMHGTDITHDAFIKKVANIGIIQWAINKTF